MTTRSRAISFESVCKKRKLGSTGKEPLIFEDRYAECWIPILDYVRLEDIVELRAVHPGFKVIVDHFYAKGVVKIDDLFMDEYPFSTYRRLYKHIGQRTTQLRVSYISYDSDIHHIACAYFPNVQELTLVAVTISGLSFRSRTLQVQNLSLIHCEKDMNLDFWSWNIDIKGLLTMYKSNCFLLRVIPYIRHLRFIETINFWDGFDGVEWNIESLELRVGVLTANTIQAEPLVFSELKRLTIKADYIWGDWNIRFPALEYLSLEIPNTREQREAFKVCYGNEIASWKCAKKLKALVVPYHSKNYRWLKTFMALKKLTILDKDAAKEPNDFAELSTTHPSLKIVQRSSVAPKPATAINFDSLPDNVLLKIIDFLLDSEHNYSWIPDINDRFDILTMIHARSYEKGTPLVDKDMVKSMPLLKHYPLYVYMGQRLTSLYLEGLAAKELHYMLIACTNLTFLRLDSSSIEKYKDWNWFPNSLKEIELGEDVVVSQKDWNSLYKARMKSLERISAPVWAMAPVKDIKHLGISLVDLQTDLSAFWKRNQRIQSLEIISNILDTEMVNNGQVARNWRAIGALKKLRSFSCNFLEVPHMQLPYTILEEVHILKMDGEPTSCGFLNQVGPQLRVLSMALAWSYKTQIEMSYPEKLPETIQRFASLERLEFRERHAFLHGYMENAILNLKKLKTLRYQYFSLEGVLEVFQELPKLTEVKVDPNHIHELNWTKMRVFQRDLANLECHMGRPMAIAFTKKKRGM